MFVLVLLSEGIDRFVVLRGAMAADFRCSCLQSALGVFMSFNDSYFRCFLMDYF
jgi:hypothetical protein